MRWGIHDPCTDDHMFSEVSLEELNLCQELSTGPNFVVSKLNRYHSFVAFFSPFISFFLRKTMFFFKGRCRGCFFVITLRFYWAL